MCESAAKSYLSDRAHLTASKGDFLLTYLFAALGNPYDAKDNLKGVINLGTAVNSLMAEELEQRLRRDDVLQFSPHKHMKYFESTGLPSARAAVSTFLQKWFSEGKEVLESEVFIMNGATSCMESLAYACCDAEDVVITPTPVYGRVFTNFRQRFGVEVECLDLKPKGKSSASKFELVPSDLEDLILKLVSEGRRVRAFILLNPQNPLGVVYPPELVLQLMQICAKHSMHFIIDEIYGLTIHDENTTLKSVLSFDQLPDPDRTHFIWSMSKDFALPGFRCGVLYSKNQEMHKLIKQWSNYHSVPSIVQDTVATILSDNLWCETFIKTSRKRIGDHYKLATNRLRSEGIETLDSTGGLFIWANFSQYLKTDNKEEEIKLFEELLERGVYVVPGTVMSCTTPGWFRIICTEETETLMEGINRILSTLQERRNMLQDN